MTARRFVLDESRGIIMTGMEQITVDGFEPMPPDEDGARRVKFVGVRRALADGTYSPAQDIIASAKP